MQNTSSFSSRLRFRLLSVFLLPFLFVSCSFKNNPVDGTFPELLRPTPLNDWLYRGSQPNEEGLARLKEKGVRTVVNFRYEPKWIAWEKERVEGLGMSYVSLPWNIMKPVEPEILDQFFEALDNPRNRPVFIHCEHGRDRTGVMSTLALMRYEKMSEPEARELALETIHPHRRYQYFVNKKINFLLKMHASAISESSAPDRRTNGPARQAIDANATA